MTDFTPITELLSFIVDNRGKSVPTADKGIPLIATNCIKTNSIYPTFENIRYVSKEVHDNWFRAHLKPNDILFVNKGTPGRVCLVPNPVEFCAAQDMVGFRCDPKKIDYKYLFAVLRSDYIQKTISNYHVGLVIPHFKKQDLKNLRIPRLKPSIESFIGESYLELSKKIEINNKINTDLEAIAKLIYEYWFVQFDFPDDKGKPYKSSGGKMVFNEELKREIPEGWKIGGFDDLGRITGGTTPSKSSPENFSQSNGDTPWITPRDLSLNTGNKFITRGEFDVTSEGIREGSLKVMPPGTVLLTSRAPIGYVAISRLNTTTNQGFKSIVPNNILSTEYIYFTVKLYVDAMIQYASGSTFKEISGTVLKTIKIPLPNQYLVSEFKRRVSPIFEQQNIIELQNEKLMSLRDWLLPMLMNGQVTVGDVKSQLEKDSNFNNEYESI